MKKLLLVSVLGLSACNNFDALVERCVAEGRCGEGGGAGEPNLSAQPSMLSFSLVSGDVAPTSRLTIQNASGATAESLTFNLGGINAADFKLTNSCGTTLSVSQSCLIDIGFQPSVLTVGTRSAVLEIRASQGAPVLVPLSGEVTLALDVATELDFGDVPTGEQKTLALTVLNRSTRPATVVPSVQSPFAIASNGCAPVGPQQPCTLQLVFNAPAAGERVETLQLGISGSTATQSVTLRGRSVTVGVLRLGPTPLFTDAGATALVGTSTDTIFRLTNTGLQRANDLSWTLDSDGGVFSIVDAGCSALDAGDFCEGVLRFSPSTYGLYPVSISVDAGPIGTATLSGVGRATANVNLSFTLVPADAGAEMQFLDGGRCANSCQLTQYVDPGAPLRLVVTTPRTAFLDEAVYSGGCTGSTCDVPLESAYAITATMERVPIGFVTSSWVPGNMGGLQGADEMCGRVAADAGLPGTYRAVLGVSDGGAGLRRFAAGQWLVRPDGGVFTSLPPGIPYRTWVTERGAAASSSYDPWTGLELDGGSVTTMGLTCNDWTYGSSTGNPIGRIGQADELLNWPSGGSGWSSSQFADLCGSQRPLLCAGTGTGRPLFPSRDGGVVMFVAQANNTYTRPDGGFEDFDSVCSAAAERLGFGPDAGLVYLSAATSAYSRFQSFDAGTPGPLQRHDGLVLAASWLILRQNDWEPLVPITFGVFQDGGVGPVSNPISTSSSGSNYGTLGQNQNQTGTQCSQFMMSGSSTFFAGSALSTTYWWSAPNISVTSACTGPRFVYCVARP